MSDNKKLFFGLKRSKVDQTEKKLSMPQCNTIDLPSSFSLKSKVKQVYNQMSMNSCSANAAANFLSLSDKVDCNISRLFLYFCTRYVDNNYMLPIADSGATLRNVFTSINQYHCHCVEEVKYPYEIEMVNSIPPREIFEEAITVDKCSSISYRQIMPTKYNLKYILAQLKKPILFGIMVYSNFFKLTKEHDILDVPLASDEVLGGHAVVIISYSDETETFGILNSHGSDFADGGYFRLKYEYALNPDLAFEYYVVD